MIISDLNVHNIRGLNLKAVHDVSHGIAGSSGSGKSSFCGVLSAESKKRLVTLLPKVEYQFLFPDLIRTNYGAFDISEIPLIHYLRNHTVNLSPRSTIGTHTGIFRAVRAKFATESRTSSEFFSFNLPLNWCPKCKGRGSIHRAICPQCKGTRYSGSVLRHKLKTASGSFDIASVNGLAIETIVQLADDLGVESREQKVAENIVAMGMGYLSLDRTIGTLSGGELTRLHLAEHMASSESILLVVDELSLGVDQVALRGILSNLEVLGKSNQLWLIDHSETVLEATQEHLYFGPGSGSDGGRLIDSLPECEQLVPPKCSSNGKWLTFRNLNCRVVQIPSLDLPLGQMLVVTGESGCGKSTLMRDCVATGFTATHPAYRLTFIGQGRFQAVTSRSTIATFLGVTDLLRGQREGKRLRCGHCGGSGLQEDSLECTWCLGTGFDPEFYQSTVSGTVTVHDVLTRPISEIQSSLPATHTSSKRLGFLDSLGAGYLTLGRAVRTLSTGEFQRVHLAAEAGGADIGDKTILLFDEPSRGLSQNFLNSFIGTLRKLIDAHGCTVWMIEHNPFLLKNADYVADFGRRSSVAVTSLEVQPYTDWVRRNHSAATRRSPRPITSSLAMASGIEHLKDSANRRAVFTQAKNDFQGGLLKDLSATARWVYGEVPGRQFAPVVAIDFEDDLLYSTPTFCFELADIGNRVVGASEEPEDELRFFDYNDREMQCKSCKGGGTIHAFDVRAVVADPAKPFWDGLLRKEVMDALRNYNYTKIRHLFREIKSTTKLDLAKAPSRMSKEEQQALWYGLWDRTFYEPKKGSYYIWRGLNHLIQKYMKSSKTTAKAELRNASQVMTCPICKGAVLFHNRQLLIKGRDVRDLLRCPIAELARMFPKISIIGRLSEYLPEGTRADMDVSTFDRPTQVRLKLFEIASRGFLGFRFYFDNVLPFVSAQDTLIRQIGKRNVVTICDAPEITSTRADILARFQPFGFDGRTYAWEAMGYDRVSTEINRVKKSHPCSYCGGKGRFEVESPDDTVDVSVVPCSSCRNEGLSPAGFSLQVQDVSIHTWLTGTVADLPLQSDAAPALRSIPLMQRLNAVEKPALLSLLSFLEANLQTASVKKQKGKRSNRPTR